MTHAQKTPHFQVTTHFPFNLLLHRFSIQYYHSHNPAARAERLRLQVNSTHTHTHSHIYGDGKTL
jgi:hypothetical protein